MSGNRTFDELEAQYLEDCSYDSEATPQGTLGRACAEQLRITPYVSLAHMRAWFTGANLFANKHGIQFDPDLILTLLERFTQTWENWNNSRGTC